MKNELVHIRESIEGPMAFNETTTLMNTTGREYYQGPIVSAAPLRSLTTARATAGPACRCKHGGNRLHTRGSPLLPGALAVALAALGLTVIQAFAADFERIHSFGDTNRLGTATYAEVIEGRNAADASDGWLYGTTRKGGKSIDHGTVFKVHKDDPANTYEVLHHFYETDHRPNDGATPWAGLVQGCDPTWLYGTTRGGGGWGNAGTVYKVHTNGTASGYEVLHSFDMSTDGGWPVAGLIEDSDGWLYGTASVGGSGSAGTVFKVNKDGSGYQVLQHFRGYPDEGSTPESALALGTDGYLYGTTSAGGSAAYGTVFKLKKDGSQGEVLHHFQGSGYTTDGFYPKAGLVFDSAGEWLYGTTERSTAGWGTVFKVYKNVVADGYTVIRNFTGTDGVAPSSRLLMGSAGWCYGTAAGGGPVTSYGTVFKFNCSDPGTTLEVLTNFTSGPTNGAFPRVGLALGSDDHLFGTTTGGGTADQGTVFKVNKTGSGPFGSGPYDCQLVWSFKTEGGDGADAQTPLVADRDGWLYGVTKGGGEYRLGTVFRTQKQEGGTYTYEVLHSFGGPDVETIGPNGPSRAPDGHTPRGGLLLASDGKLYGITTSDARLSSGTVFTIGKDRQDYRVLWRFREKDYYNDGFGPYGALVEDCDGWLYGTTYWGGGSRPGYPVNGTVFRLKKDGSRYSIIKRFPCEAGPNPDGYSPSTGLVLDQDWLYGTTYYGGSGTCDTYSYGTVFKLNRHGTNYGYETIYRFIATKKNETDPYPLAWEGAYPSELILDHTGEWLYGTTYRGGSYPYYGTVYRLKKDNPDSYDLDSCEVLWDFATAGYANGMEPLAGLLEGADGFFYGTASGGGTHTGTIFKVRKVEEAIERQVVHHFWGDGDATGPGAPHAALVRGNDCAFYSTTALGGDMGWGTVYRLDAEPADSPPLAVADTLVTTMNTPVTVPTLVLTENDVQCGGEDPSIDFVYPGFPEFHGAPVLDVEPDRITYQPHADYVGWDNFTYLLVAGA